MRRLTDWPEDAWGRLGDAWGWLQHPPPPPDRLVRFDEWFLTHTSAIAYVLLVFGHVLAYGILWWQRRRGETSAARTMRWFVATGALIWVVLWSYNKMPDDWFLWSRFGLVMTTTITVVICLLFPWALIHTYVQPAWKARKGEMVAVPPVEQAVLPPVKVWDGSNQRDDSRPGRRTTDLVK